MQRPMKRSREGELRTLLLPAVRITQGGGRPVFVFGVDGKDVAEFSAISRLRSGDLGEVLGYQRPEVLSHIAQIREYLEGQAPILPNALVLAFKSTVEFTPAAGAGGGPFTHGTLRVEWRSGAEPQARPAWVVDGQQRLAAIRDANVASFPVCATAFITDDQDVQREQFLLLNSTRPLPKSLIYELLPGTGALLPEHLARRRVPAHLTRRLNLEENSPFFGRIRLATNPKGVIRDNSLMRMLDHSLSDGALLRIRLSDLSDEEKEEGMMHVLRVFWTAVARTWPEAWSLPPRRSRLLHGAGVVSLGFVMDEMAEAHREDGGLSELRAATELEQLRDVCFWTAGVWPFGEGRARRWSEVQNTTKDINLLSNYLLRQYRLRVRQAAAGAGSPS